MNTRQFNLLLFWGLIGLPIVILCFVKLWIALGYGLCVIARGIEQYLISKYGDNITQLK